MTFDPEKIGESRIEYNRENLTGRCNVLKKFNRVFDYRFTPLLLLILTIVSFGLFANSIGLMMDDWYITWFSKTFGAAQFTSYFALDRPLMGYYFTAAFTLLGGSVSPLVWQIFGVFLRWLCAYAFWGMLNTIWPSAKRQNTWVALLAAVFPGFIQHWIVVVYSFFYACLAGFLFSITLLVKALRDRKHFWIYYPLSLILAFYCVAGSEFFYGLEVLRLAVIWVIISKETQGFWPRLWRSLKYYAAYLVVFLTFAIWRLFFFTSVNHKVTIIDQLKSSPLSTILDAIRQVYQSAYYALVGTWTQTLDATNYPSNGIKIWVILALIVFTFIGVFFWMKKNANPSKTEDDQTHWSKQAFWVSTFSLVFVMLPFWAAGLSVANQYPNDRFLLAYLPVACLWLVAFIEIISQNRSRVASILLSLLVASSLGFQFTQGLHYRNLWTQQANLYWQLVWRMPGIKPNTTVMSWTLPYREFYSDQALSAELNWTYGGKIGADRVVPYKYALLESNNQKVFKDLIPNVDFTDDFRTYTFKGNTSQSILVFYDGANCLRVMDATLTPPTGLIDFYTPGMLDAAELSDPALILQQDQANPPVNVVGSEPAHGWCYYFEKAELARQYGDYPGTIDLLKEAQSKGFEPLVPTEWYPFLDAYLNLEKMEKALTISQDVLSTNSKVYETGVCNIWQNYRATLTDPGAIGPVEDAMKSLSCK